MRKHLCLLIAAFLAVALLASLCFGCTNISSKAEPTFFESTHLRNDGYGATFEVYSAQGVGVILNVQKSIFEQQSATDFLHTIERDIQKIEDTFPKIEVPVIAVYLVDKTIDGYVCQYDKSIYCTEADINNKTYFDALIEALFDFTQPWMFEGAAALASERNVDEAALRIYYSKRHDANLLSLFAGYFCKDFVTQEELQVAKDTAAALAKYVISNYGMESFLSGVTPDQKNEWLLNIGASEVYTNEDEESFNGYTYSRSKEYPLIVTTAEYVIYFKRIPGEIESVEQVKQVLKGTQKCIADMKALIRDHAPRSYELIKDTIDEPIHYYFQTHLVNGRAGEASSFFKSINLSTSFAIPHETAHVLIQAKESNSAWRYEGIAEYLFYTIAPDARDREVSYSEFLEMIGAEQSQFDQLRVQYYLNHAQYPKSAEEFDVAEYQKATAAVTLAYPNINVDFLGIKFREPIKTFRQEDPGNGLTYPQAHLLIAYLVDQYSLDAVLEFCLKDSAFEVAFGRSYEEVMEELVESLVLEFDRLN